MFETLTNPIVVSAATVVLAVASAAAYSFLTGNEASADIDNDGESEVTFGTDEE